MTAEPLLLMRPRNFFAEVQDHDASFRATGADMTAYTPESVSSHLADRTILVTGTSRPPRDPNDDNDDVEEDGDDESDEDEPAVIREPDE
jgi:hypothetical protein